MRQRALLRCDSVKHLDAGSSTAVSGVHVCKVLRPRLLWRLSPGPQGYRSQPTKVYLRATGCIEGLCGLLSHQPLLHQVHLP